MGTRGGSTLRDASQVQQNGPTYTWRLEQRFHNTVCGKTAGDSEGRGTRARDSVLDPIRMGAGGGGEKDAGSGSQNTKCQKEGDEMGLAEAKDEGHEEGDAPCSRRADRTPRPSVSYDPRPAAEQVTDRREERT